MNSPPERPQYQILSHLLKSLVTERFKRMAKDEVLFRFITGRIDPALLIDHQFQAEREALDLAEMSLLKLVDSGRMKVELLKSAERIQQNYQQLFGIEVSKEFAGRDAILKRRDWLDIRVEFYRKWLSIQDQVDSPIELAYLSFRSAKSFGAVLTKMAEIDRIYAEEVVSSTNSMFRFLMKKQMDYELQNAEKLWREFMLEAFKKPAELP